MVLPYPFRDQNNTAGITSWNERICSIKLVSVKRTSTCQWLVRKLIVPQFYPNIYRTNRLQILQLDSAFRCAASSKIGKVCLQQSHQLPSLWSIRIMMVRSKYRPACDLLATAICGRMPFGKSKAELIVTRFWLTYFKPDIKCTDALPLYAQKRALVNRNHK